MPPIRLGKGPVAIFPPNKKVKSFFDKIGQTIEIKNEKLVKIKGKFLNINSYGSIGCEYFDIALGKRDFALLSRLYPWDHIPGVFIIRQSGGHDCHFDKKEYKFYKDSRNLIVSNSKSLNYDILKLIEGG